MLGKLIGCWKSIIGVDANVAKGPEVIPRSKHCISRQSLSPNALKVLYRLKKHGYEAYLVGGGIRDVLLGIEPKDFDVVTNARPWEIKKLFTNCRLIGKRFRLAHVYFNSEIIEVATFRAAPGQDDHKMTTRDNSYGTFEEDVWRRDFTINAIYYNIQDFSLVDCSNGMRDIENKLVRIIGDPSKRYVEDPVRMIRAIRFSAKLDFAIENSTAQGILAWRHLLLEVAGARMFEEFKKLFLTGCSAKVFELFIDFKIVELLFPQTEEHIQNPIHLRFIINAFLDTDDRYRHAKTLNPGFIIAVLLWPKLIDEIDKGRINRYGERMIKTMEQVLSRQKNNLAIPKHVMLTVQDIWSLQFKLDSPSASNVSKLFSHSKFRAGYDFMCIRHQAYDIESEIPKWWSNYLDANEKTRWGMVQALQSKKHDKLKRNNRKSKSE